MTSLNDFAVEPGTPTTGGSSWTDDQVSFLTALKENKLRIAYGGASLLKLPVAKGKLNRGQHGSGIVKSLPLNLQPVVCRKGGDYHEKAEAAFKTIDGFSRDEGEYEGLDTWKIVPADKVAEAFASFLAERDAE